VNNDAQHGNRRNPPPSIHSSWFVLFVHQMFEDHTLSSLGSQNPSVNDATTFVDFFVMDTINNPCQCYFLLISLLIFRQSFVPLTSEQGTTKLRKLRYCIDTPPRDTSRDFDRVLANFQELCNVDFPIVATMSLKVVKV
jgi:hypothetical protein